MYGGMLPDTGGFINPLRVLYVLIALFAFGGAWVVRKFGGRTVPQDVGEGK